MYKYAIYYNFCIFLYIFLRLIYKIRYNLSKKGGKAVSQTLRERIQYVRKHFKFKSRNDMSVALGIDALRLQNLENGRSKNLLINEALLFKTILKVNPWWLMSGQGCMMLAEENKIETLYTESEFKIKLLGGTQEKSHISLDKLLLPDFKGTAQELCAMRILDDSMSPSFNEGDYAIIGASTTIDTAGVYLFLIGEKFALNRVAIRADRMLEISYDNASYKSYCANQNDIEILGKVILGISHK